MPLYEYECRNCGERVEQRLSYEEYDENGLVECPSCGGNLQRDYSAVYYSNEATPTRFHDRKQKPPKVSEPSWEKGVVTDKRPGGTEMPLLNPDHSPVHVKQYAENRRAIDARVKQIKNS